MKRPSFQFYPGDWGKNAKLRFCSLAARGAWMEVICLLHDSDEYGILRRPLKDIANAAGIPLKLLKELADNGVMKGCDKGQCQSVIYRYKNGTTVITLEQQAGPVWFSSRMINDEYLRQVRAEGGEGGKEHGSKGAEHGSKGGRPSNSEGGNKPPLDAYGKPPLKPPPSSSSSSSEENNNGNGGARPPAAPTGNPDEAFALDIAWKPSDQLHARMRMAGIPADLLSPEALVEFTSYWATRPEKYTQAEWEHRLLQRLIALKSNPKRGSSHDDQAGSGTHPGGSQPPRKLTPAEQIERDCRALQQKSGSGG